jgi:hypothetical protein
MLLLFISWKQFFKTNFQPCDQRESIKGEIKATQIKQLCRERNVLKIYYYSQRNKKLYYVHETRTRCEACGRCQGEKEVKALLCWE